MMETQKLIIGGEEIEYQVGSGNVFADLGLPDADKLFAAGEVLIRVQRRIEGAGWTHAEAAARARITRRELSSLLRGRHVGLTTARLAQIAARLGCGTDTTPTRD